MDKSSHCQCRARTIVCQDIVQLITLTSRQFNITRKLLPFLKWKYLWLSNTMHINFLHHIRPSRVSAPFKITIVSQFHLYFSIPSTNDPNGVCCLMTVTKSLSFNPLTAFCIHSGKIICFSLSNPTVSRSLIISNNKIIIAYLERTSSPS